MVKEDFHNWFSSKVDDVKEQNKKLTAYDITMNTIKQENMFKGTIVICIVYALFGFLLVLLSYFSESVRDLLFIKFLPFTLVYIIGTIIIIFVMLYYIFTFEPVKIDRHNDIDDISCPDYWKVEIIDEKYIGDSFDKNYANDFKYRCVIDDTIFDKENMYKYHNSNNYRMTNISTTVKTDDNTVGKFNATYNSSFSSDYNNNKDLYNIYVDVNNYGTNFNANKKALAKDLNIYNDSKRVDNIYSNLRTIAVLENNYAIDSDNTANDLIASSNILNPDVNFAIFNIDNNSNTSYLNNTNSNNSYNIINWNGLTNNFFDNIFTEKPKMYGIKVAIKSKTTLGTYYCMGRINKNTENNYIFTKDITTEIKNIYDDAPDSIKNTVNYTLISTLFKITKEDGNNNSNVITASSSNYENIGNGPIIKVYDKTKYRPESIQDLHVLNNSDKKNNKIAPLLCDTVYPKLFSKFESYDINNENNNDIRCAYSKICGIPWSDLRCPSN